MSDDSCIPTPAELETAIAEALRPHIEAQINAIILAMKSGETQCTMKPGANTRAAHTMIRKRMRARGWAISFNDDQRASEAWCTWTAAPTSTST